MENKNSTPATSSLAKYNFEHLTEEFESAKQLLITMGATGSAVLIGANHAVKVKTGIDCLALTGVDPDSLSAMPNIIDMVHVERFIFQCCIIDVDAKIARSWINQAYKEYCKTMNIVEMGKTNFLKSFAKKFQIIKIHGNPYYKGITLRNSIINQMKETETETEIETKNNTIEEV